MSMRSSTLWRVPLPLEYKQDFCSANPDTFTVLLEDYERSVEKDSLLKIQSVENNSPSSFFCESSTVSKNNWSVW